MKNLNDAILKKDKEVNQVNNEVKTLSKQNSEFEMQIKKLSSDRDIMINENRQLKKFKEDIEEEKKK